jgi:hypothetical protein
MNDGGCLALLVKIFFSVLSQDSQLKARDRFIISIMFVFICIAPLTCIFTIASPNTIFTQNRVDTPLRQNVQQQLPDDFTRNLTLEEVISDTFVKEQRVNLFHFDDTSVVATLHIVVEQGELPTIRQVTRNDQGDREFISHVPDDDNAFKLCGYEFRAGYFYTFTFRVSLTTFYKIEFEPGNTCDS